MSGTNRRVVVAITGPRTKAFAPRLLIALGVWLAGGKPVQLRPNQSRHAAYDAVVISGGHDIDPVLYAQETQVHPNYDPERDAFELEIIRDGLQRGIPMLGICRGAQLLNVCCGGDLHQDLRAHRHETAHTRTIFPHKVVCIEPRTVLREILGEHRVSINSLHNQAINRIGHGLRVSGRDLDNLVQAIESVDTDHILGVQWHPEFLLYSAAHRSVFRWLVDATVATNSEALS